MKLINDNHPFFEKAVEMEYFFLTEPNGVCSVPVMVNGPLDRAVIEQKNGSAVVFMDIAYPLMYHPVAHVLEERVPLQLVTLEEPGKPPHNAFVNAIDFSKIKQALEEKFLAKPTADIIPFKGASNGPTE